MFCFLIFLILLFYKNSFFHVISFIFFFNFLFLSFIYFVFIVFFILLLHTMMVIRLYDEFLILNNEQQAGSYGSIG